MRFLIESTHTYGTHLNTGIQRVVRCIVNETLKNPHGRDVQTVGWINGEFRALEGSISAPPPPTTTLQTDRGGVDGLFHRLSRSYKAVLRKSYRILQTLIVKAAPYPPLVEFVNAPYTKPGLARILRSIFYRKDQIPEYFGPVITPGENDVLILLDSSWHIELWEKVREWRTEGICVVAVIYDLIPFTHPHYVVQDLRHSYNAWMISAAKNSDAYICISKTVSEQLREFITDLTKNTQLCISHFVLGSELDSAETHLPAEIRDRVTRLSDSSDPFYMYVSTIEPRKNHSYALDAFDLLWEQNINVRFVIVGRIGWDCDDFIARVESHPQYGKRLFLLNDISDAELDYFYRRVNGLVFTSYAEGFGLPIVEALQYGAPVFASDIPVFREISCRGVHFIDISDPANLAHALSEHLRSGAMRLGEAERWPDWEASTRGFWDAVDRCLSDIGHQSNQPEAFTDICDSQAAI